MVEAILPVDTVLGRFLITAKCPTADPADVKHELHYVDVATALPLGMSVLRRRCVLFHFQSNSKIFELHWSCEFLGSIAGTPCTGEGLEAQEWIGEKCSVTVGTEDDDCLASRLPYIQLFNDKTLMTLTPKRMDLVIPHIPPKGILSVHYIIAENELPEPAEASAWFAVDVPHNVLLRSLL